MNRPPRTKLVMALGGVFLAASAFFADAAGLGRLSVNSSLGQPLSAEIELMSLQPGEFESIAARVASPEAYTDARVEYSPLLRQLRFSVERRADGKPIVKVTSLAPINEPFLDVLVEMSWPSGKLLREYPILLDPPGFSEARVAAPAVTPRATAPSVPAAAVTAPQPQSAPRTVAPSTTSRDAPGDTYGPVKAGDTLNKIASSVKPDTVSLEQMLVALYRENKSAFIGNNMNQLKTGQILRVPTSADVGKITRAEAQKEIKVQVSDWKGYRDSVAGAAQSMAPKASAANEGAGKIAVAKPDKPTTPSATGDQLKIAKSDSGNAKAGSAGAKGSVQEQLNALREESIAKDNRLKEANSRVAELEKQIAKMRELADLKGIAPPAKADAKPADTKTAKVDEKPKAPEPAKVAPPAVTPPVDPKVAQVTPTPAKPAEPVKAGEPAKVEAPKVDVPKVDAPKVETPAVAPPKAPDAKPAVAKTPPPAPAPEPSFIEENAVALAATTAAILGGAGLFFMSRRKKKPLAAPTSQMVNTSSIMPSDMKPNTVTGNRAGGLVDTGNSSFLTDFDKTGPGMIDTDEVDPVAEAEVYIAYGRDAQAEEILKEAMGRDKNRHEIAVKLLEIYHSRKSPQAFEPVARELKDAIGVDNPTWAKVSSLGASIDPTNPLYGGSGAGAVSTVAKVAAGGALIAGAGAAVAAASSSSSPVAPSVPDVDFDLGFTETAPSSMASSSASHDKVAQVQKQAMDFDLDLNSPTPSASAAAAPAAPEASSTLDFDLAFDVPSDTPSAPTAPVAAAKSASSSTFDFDLSSLSLDTPPAATPVAPAASSAAAGLEQIFATTINAKASDLSPSHAKPVADNLSGISFDMGAGSDGDGGSGSAAATKLELAKAYIEIGDADGAKEILHEVVREGSAAQREAANKILSGI
jgi:pilus assembly protein FimV